MWNNDYPILYRIDDRNCLWVEINRLGEKHKSIAVLGCIKVINITENTIVYKGIDEELHTVHYCVELNNVIVF